MGTGLGLEGWEVKQNCVRERLHSIEFPKVGRYLQSKRSFFRVVHLASLAVAFRHGETCRRDERITWTTIQGVLRTR